MKISSSIEFLFGLWLIGSPWLLGYGDVAPALWNAAVVGVGIMLVAIWRLFGFEPSDAGQAGEK